jgi:hypothetical protein
MQGCCNSLIGDGPSGRSHGSKAEASNENLKPKSACLRPKAAVIRTEDLTVIHAVCC